MRTAKNPVAPKIVIGIAGRDADAREAFFLTASSLIINLNVSVKFFCVASSYLVENALTEALDGMRFQA